VTSWISHTHTHFELGTYADKLLIMVL